MKGGKYYMSAERLATQERVWLVRVIEAIESDIPWPNEPDGMNFASLKRRLAPTPELVMREALEAIRDRRPGDATDTGSPISPYPHELAEMALKLADGIARENKGL